MSLRQTISDKPVLAVVLLVGLLLVAGALFAFQMRGSGAFAAGGGNAFFSVDDGKSWFADDATKVPPFTKDGKEAVRAHVYRSADGTKFVNHLERFKPEAKQALEDAKKADQQLKQRPDRTAIQSAYIGGREVKRPGDANWINASNFREAAQVTSIKCPNGAKDAILVEP
jgi:hypothetical protein